MTAVTVQRPTWWQRNQRRLAPYFFIAPFYILFIVFFLGPGVFALYLSLHSWNGIGPLKFVGISNFKELLTDAVFLKALRNTAFYSGASLFVVTPISLLLAVALNARLVRFKDTLRTIYFTPIVTSSVAISIIFLVLYNHRSGLLNTLLGYMGIDPINWLGSKQWSKFAVLGLVTWRWAGFNAIYFLAGLQTIPQTLYEAAMVDGSTRLGAFFRIALPLTLPGLVVAFLFAFVFAWNEFLFALILTGRHSRTMPVALASLMTSQGNQVGAICAATVAMMVPIVLLTWIIQRYLVRGLTFGALK